MTTSDYRRLFLSVAVNSTGSAARSWTWPGTRWNRFSDWDHYLRSAQLAHDGVFDIVFVLRSPRVTAGQLPRVRCTAPTRRTNTARAAGGRIDDPLWANGLLIGTPEHFGYMAGAIKDFMDRTPPILRKARSMGRPPYAVFVQRGNDGTGRRERDRPHRARL